MAGFGRNGSRSSAKAIASAGRHGVWINLRKQGHLEKDIARRYGVSQQAVSKAVLKYARDVPKGEAELLRWTHLAYLASMYKMADEACERAKGDKLLLKFIITAVHVMERQAKLLGLDAEVRNHAKTPESKQPETTIWNHLAQTPPTDLETIKRIQELDPIEKPDCAKEP